ncbi:MAG: D-alanyl-D-alanine carboxypeptidase [Ruminococcus sp.]|nr:D-alanyl-D-alanine carboxypeptidase [Ruminococcus sp.]
MKKLIAAVCAAGMALAAAVPMAAQAMSFPLKTPIQSESAMLINLDSDTVIHEKNADTKQMPGPLVNIMTAVVCLENCQDLDQEITIHENIFEDLYVTDYPDDLRFAEIEDGDVLKITDLLYAMMLTSSIEASQTIAYTIGGESVAVFVEMMNKKAEELGLENTHFTNPTGMFDEDQYTTARDMATLTQYALSVPMFETVSTPFSYKPSVPNPASHPDTDEWVWYHSNTMMDESSEDYYYPGTRGIKTANLERGGRNIVTIASRDGNNYLAVLLKSPLSDADGNNTYYHLTDAISMFNWAFSHFSYEVILADTAEVGELPVSLADGNDYVLAKPKEELTVLWYDEIDISTVNKDNIVWYKDQLQAPVKKGDLLGQVTLAYSGEELGTVDIVAVSDVERSFSKYNIYAVTKFPKSDWFKKALAVSCVLCAIYILFCIYSYIVFKSRSKPLKPIYAVPKVDKPKKKKK